VVNGEKVWTSYANIARRGFLLARSTPGSAPAQRPVVLLLDMNTRASRCAKSPPSGLPPAAPGALRQRARAASGLLGPENEGWRVAMTALSFERTGNARYARSNRMLGFVERLPDAKDPAIQERIAEALAFGYVTERMNYMVGSMKERDELPTCRARARASAACCTSRKWPTSPSACWAARPTWPPTTSTATFMGELEAFVVRDSPMCTIGAGSYEIQQSVVAEFALDLPRSR